MLRALQFSFVVLCLTGCGSSDITLVEVSGKVTLDGVPLEGATVNFQPSSTKIEAPSSFGRTDADGRFELSTAAGKQGAIPGQHRVRISKSSDPEGEENDEVIEFDDPVPAEYRDEGKDFTIPENGTTEANFDI
jgi:hypothetical protein